jgi:nitroreductase
MAETKSARKAQAPADPQFIERWSPRAFSPEPLPAETLATLFEAARWAPSCFNEQPWLFLYATTPEDKAPFLSCLVEFNRIWAGKAPVLAFVLAKRSFAKNGNPNRWAPFDAGAAWMSLALQAHGLGLCTHAMAGFDEDRVYEVLQVPRDKYEVMAAIAIGKRGDPDGLPAEVLKDEAPNERKALGQVAWEGVFRG